MSTSKEKRLYKKLSNINIETESIIYYIRTANPTTFNLLVESKGAMIWYSFVKNQYETNIYDLVGTYTYKKENEKIIPSYNDKVTMGLDINLMALILYPSGDDSKVYFSPKPIKWLVRQRLPSNVSISPRWKNTVLEHFHKYMSFSSYSFALVYLFVCSFDIELCLTDEDWKLFDKLTNNITNSDLITHDICSNLLIKIENEILTN
jgi:hypothetical protein